MIAIPLPLWGAVALPVIAGGILMGDTPGKMNPLPGTFLGQLHWQREMWSGSDAWHDMGFEELYTEIYNNQDVGVRMYHV